MATKSNNKELKGLTSFAKKQAKKDTKAIDKGQKKITKKK